MRTKTLVAVTIEVVAVLALLAGAWYLVNHRQVKICPFSGREIHPQARALVTIGGERVETCCLRCAIIEAQQTGKLLRVLKVADFETGKFLDPGSAWLVDGSAVNICMRMSSSAESQGRGSVYLRAFDRCSPSILAFSSEQQARAFIGQHGGSLKRLADLQSEVTPNSGKVQTP